jgi:hypothetical protein
VAGLSLSFGTKGLLRLRESIQGKIDELKRIMAEVDDMIEKRAGGL